jgi:murein DD-endopeptidase MepM/ murein hydrolase activator NlpD
VIRTTHFTRPLLLLLVVSAVTAPSAFAAEEAVVTTPAPAPTVTSPPPPASPSVGTPAPQPTTPSAAPAEPAAPQVQAKHSQGASPGTPSTQGATKAKTSPRTGAPREGALGAGPRAKQKALSPSVLTPALPPGLQGAISGVPGFFIENFQIPPFLLPIYQAAGAAYGVPWQVLAAINEVETDYGRDLSVSSAGAEGWMQFLPAEWAQYGVDANGDGFMDPYNPSDAIFAAARYLRAAGGDTNIRAAVFSYNHSDAYVASVMLRAQLLGGTPSELLGAITGLTEAHFPVHAASHFGDGFATIPASGSQPARTLVGTTIDAAAGAPVIAVQDGEVVQIGRSAALGRFIVLRDAFGNTYVYSQLGDVAAVYPVLQPHVHSTVSRRIGQAGEGAEPAPTGPATAGAQPRSPFSEAGTISGLALGAAAGLESAPAAASPAPKPRARPLPSGVPKVRVFRDGANDVYLHPLRAGSQVIAGTVLGHVGAASGAAGLGDPQPHLFLQIRPAGVGAPLIDPKPILDGWVALENTSIFRAKGENPFLATSPTIGQVLLESKQQLEPQVLHDGGIRLGACGRQDVQSGRVDKRVLAMLEYLSVSGLNPTVSGLRCNGTTPAALAANVPAGASTDAVDISAVNGIPIAGHQGQGSIADTTVRKLLMLQGLSRPSRILSLLSYPGAAIAVASPRSRAAIRVSFGAPGAALAAGLLNSSLSSSQWIKLTARLGEIPDPTVGRGPSAAAIPDRPAKGGAGGNG